MLKDNIEVCGETIKNFINRSICTCSFPDKLKLAEICPIHKKDEATKKDNYRNISVLPAVSKLYERVIENQMYDYIINIFLRIYADIERVIVPSLLFAPLLKAGEKP